MKISMYPLLLLGLLIAIGYSQTKIELDGSLSISLKSSQSKTIELDLKNLQASLEDKNKLFIVGLSVTNDPLQKPELLIRGFSSNGQEKQFDHDPCQNEPRRSESQCILSHSDYSGLDKMDIEVFCDEEIDCDIRLQAYLNPIQILDLDDQVALKSQDEPATFLFEIQGISSMQIIQIVADITEIDLSTTVQSVSMYVNCGNSENIQTPTSANHQIVGKQVNDKTIAYFFPSMFPATMFQDTSQILISLQIGPNTEVIFYSRIRYGNVVNMNVNHIYDDLLSSQEKSYMIQAQEIRGYLDDHQFSIAIASYSGNPKITVYLEKGENKNVMTEFTEFTVPYLDIPLNLKDIQNYDRIFIRISTTSFATFQIQPKLTKKNLLHKYIHDGVTESIKYTGVQSMIFKYSDKLEPTKQQEYRFLIKLQPEYSENIVMFQCLTKENTIAKSEAEEKSCITEDDKNVQRKILSFQKHSRILSVSLNSKQSCYEKKDKMKCPFYLKVNKLKTLAGNIMITIKQQRDMQELENHQMYYTLLEKNQKRTFFISQFRDISLTGLNKIISYTVYSNCIVGQVRMMFSNVVPDSSTSQKNDTMLKTGSSQITLLFSEILPMTYYVSLLASEHSQCNVFSRLRYRQADDTFKSLIHLEEGVTMNYRLERKMPYQPHNSNMFSFTASKKGTYYFTVIELEGIVNYRVKKTTGEVVCERQQVEASECEVMSENVGEHFLLEIEEYEERGYEQQVAIAVVSSFSCFTYPFSKPLYQFLNNNERSCIKFSTVIQKGESSEIEFATSMNLLESIRSELKFNIVIQSSSTDKNITERHNPQTVYSFDPKNLISLCDFSHGACYLHFNVQIVAGNRKQNILMRLEKVSKPLEVFDGVFTKVQQSDSKAHYFYNINDKSVPIKIYLTSKTNTIYTITTKIIDQSIYIPVEQEMNLYPSSKPGSVKADWTTKTSPFSKCITELMINSIELAQLITKKYINLPKLLITVEFTSDNAQYQIQVTQHQRMLFEGESNIDYLAFFSAINYELYVNQKAYLEIMPLNKQCFIPLIKQSYGGSFTQIGLSTVIPLSKTQNFSSPILLTLNHMLIDTPCALKITLQNIPSRNQATPSIFEIWEQMPHAVDLQYSEQTYLFWYHNRKVEFRINQIVKNGDSELNIVSMTKTEFIKWVKGGDVWSQQQESRSLHTKQEATYLDIKTDSSIYCSDCYYVIRIKGAPSVLQEIVISPKDASVILKQGTVFEDDLGAQQIRTYTYYSVPKTDFNIVTDLKSGKLKMQVVQISLKSDITEPNINQITIQSSADQSQKIFGAMSRYTIRIRAIDQASYKIQITQRQNAIYLLEGSSTILDLKSSKMKQVLVTNNAHKLRILLSGTQQYPDVSKIILTAEVKSNLGFSDTNFTISQTMDKSLQELKVPNPQQTVYKIKLMNTDIKDAKVTFIIPRTDLVEFNTGSPYHENQQSIFEAYVPSGQQALIEMFPCQGQLMVRGSKNYNDLVTGWNSRSTSSQSQQKDLVHQNMGGHFLVRIKQKGFNGQYYIRVQNREFNNHIKQNVGEIQYMIRYYTIPNNYPSPYELIDIPSTKINVTIDGSFFLISQGNFQVLEDSQAEILGITYYYALSKNKESLKGSHLCFNSDGFKLVGVLSGSIKKSNTTSFNITKNRVFNYSQGQDTYLGVVGQAIVKYKDITYNQVVMSYEPVLMEKVKEQKIAIGLGIFGVMAVIALIIGGMVVGYAIFRKVILFLRGYDDTTPLQQQNTTVAEVNSKKKPEQQVQHSIQ